MKIKSIVHCIFITLILFQSLNAQVKVRSINSVPLEKRGLINNPVWSLDNKTVAFEFIENREKSMVMIYQVGSHERAKPLLKRKESSSTLFQTTGEISSRLPSWSTTDNNTLYFLYDQYRPRYIGKLDKMSFNDLPVNNDIVNKKYKNIIQPSGISEYYPISVDGMEYLFIKLKDSPRLILYTYSDEDIGYDDGKEISPIQSMVIPNLKIDSTEIIDSFCLFKNATKIIICKGVDKDKIFLLGKLFYLFIC